MAKKILYQNKVGIIPKTVQINQVWDDDMNEIKDVVNTNSDQMAQNTNDIQSLMENAATALYIEATPSAVYLVGTNVQLQLNQTETNLIGNYALSKEQSKNLYQTGLVRVDLDTSVVTIIPDNTLRITNCNNILFSNEIQVDIATNKTADYIKSFGTVDFIMNSTNTPLTAGTRGVFYLGLNKTGGQVYRTSKVYDQDVCYMARVIVANNAGVFSIVTSKYIPDLASNRMNRKDRFVQQGGYIIPSGAASISFGNRAISFYKNSINYSNDKLDPNYLQIPDNVGTTPMPFLFIPPNVTSLAVALVSQTTLNPTQWYTAGGAVGVGPVAAANYQVYNLLLTVTGNVLIQTKASTSNAPAPGVNAIFGSREDALAGLDTTIFPPIEPIGDYIVLGTFYLRAGTNANGSQMNLSNDFYFKPITTSTSISSVGVTVHDVLSGKNDNPSFQHVTTTDISNWNIAYTNRITSLTTTGTSGTATLVGNVLNIPVYAPQTGSANYIQNQEAVDQVAKMRINGNGTFGGSITAGSIIKQGGTPTQFLKADGSLDNNTYALASQLHNAVTIGTANGLSLSVQVLSLALAGAAATGALSSTDWNTFNSKQAALSGTGVVKSTAGTISYLADTTLGRSLLTSANIATSDKFPRANFTDNSVSWLDAAAFRSAIGAGTSSVTPAALSKVDDSNVTLTLSGTPGTALLQATTITVGWAGTLPDIRIASAATWNAKITFASVISGFAVGANSAVTAADSLEVAIEKLQGQINARTSGVAGTANTVAKFTAAGTIGNSNITDTGSLITLGGAGVTTAGNLGIKTSSYSASIGLYMPGDITGAAAAYGIYQLPVIQSDVLTSAIINATYAGTENVAFTLPNLTHYSANQGVIGASSTVTSQYGFYVNSTLVGAGTNIGFYSAIPAGTNRWNLYMGGTAQNYFAGNVGIDVTVPNNKFEVKVATADGSASGAGVAFHDGATNRQQIAFGVNTAGLYSWIQSQQVGINYRNLILNPSGGSIGIGGAPTTSAGTYDILTRNTSTGIIEKVSPSATFIQNQTASVQAGNFWISGAGTIGADSSTNANLAINGAQATTRMLMFKTASVTRWTIRADNAAESTGNVGSDFRIANYNDTGAFISDTLSIQRSTGNVSIGNADFFGKLDVRGNINFGSQSIGTIAAPVNRKLTVYNYTDTESGYLNFQDRSTDTNSTKFTIGVKNNSSVLLEAFVIDGINGGTVGIGTSTPQFPLEVAATGAAISIKGKAVGDSTYMGYYNSAGSRRGYIGYGSTSSGTFSIINEELNSHTVIGTNGTGNVGINVSAPTAKFHVVGTDFTTDAFSGIKVGDASADRLMIGYKTGVLQTGLVPAQINVEASILRLASRDIASGAIAFHTGVGVTEKMRILADGKVSINTAFATAPNQLLGVGGGIEVGHEKGDGIFYINGDYQNVSNTPYIGFSSHNTDANSRFLSFGQRAVSTGAITERMRLTSGGNIGINTTSPSTQLHIKDGTGILVQGSNAKMKLSDAANGMALRMDNSGNMQVVNNTDSGLVTFAQNGNITVATLAGTGTRMVTATAAGLLTATEAAPTSARYSPLVNPQVNLSVATSILHSYMRIGNMIIVYGTVNVTMITAATASTFNVSLPINKATTTSILAGNGMLSGNQTGITEPVQINIASQSMATVSFTINATGARIMSYSFSYFTTD